MTVLLIDSEDAFAHNLFQAVASLKARVVLETSERLDFKRIGALKPRHLIVARDWTQSHEILDRFHGHIPILGIGPGHHAIARQVGGRIIAAPSIQHGTTVGINHEGVALFEGLTNPFNAACYHAKVVDPEAVPTTLTITARGPDGSIMAVSHRDAPTYGIQFRPESIGTPQGTDLLANFLGVQREPSQEAA